MNVIIEQNTVYSFTAYTVVWEWPEQKVESTNGPVSKDEYFWKVF
jgi:hypothetical protein